MIDVGAYQGEWTRFARRLYPECSLLMIEAQEGKRQILERVASEVGRARIEMTLLGAEDGATARFVEMETGSSVFAEAGNHGHPSVQKAMRSLDAVLAAHAQDDHPVGLIKLDVQGYEIEVLKGAEAAIRRTEVVVAEASLIPVNQGCPLLHEVIAFMAERGFDVYDFGAQVRLRNAALWQTDIVFVRRGSRLWTRPAE